MTEVKKPQMFYGTLSTVESFVKECKEYIEKKMKRETIEEQITWVLTCIAGGATDRWKKMILDDLYKELQEYAIIDEFFGEIRKKFGRKEKKKIWESLDKGLRGFLEDMKF